MTDREKLVELIAQVCEWRAKHCVGCKEDLPIAAECREERFGKVADHLIANGVTVQNWRDAKTDPPEKWKDDDGNLANYLVFCPQYGVDVGSYVEPAKRWVVVGIPAPVTHWMPLPKAPKGE